MWNRSSREWITHGPVWRAVAALSAPMLISAVLQNAQSLIDLFWVGRLGKVSVAAVSMSATVLMLMNPMAMGLSTGTIALVSRAIGAKNAELASRAAGQSLFLSLVIGLISALAGWVLAEPALRLLGAEGDVIAPGASYLRISMIGSFTVYLLFIGNAALQGAGDTHTPMVVMALTNVLNIVLDPLLIYGVGPCPRMGVAGAAVATVCAQAVGAVAVVRWLMRGRSGLHAHGRTWRPDLRLSWRIMRIGIPGTGQMLSRSLMSLVLMGIVASCGTAAVAAYGIGLRFHIIILMPAFALGWAAATLMGQNLGAGLPDRAQRAVWTAAGLDVALMVVSGLALAAWAEPLVRLFSSDPEVVQIGVRYLRVVSPFYIFATFGIILGRGLNGAGDTVGPMAITILTLWGLQVPLAVYLSRVLNPATDGIWWAMNAAFVLQAALTIVWFRAGRWRTTRV
ncbi:MAG: MATE family efflux transporter [Kiritimatiellae bacterium]|nr:MATE family efflux transporter [Kiritimatiellia bacterium]